MILWAEYRELLQEACYLPTFDGCVKDSTGVGGRGVSLFNIKGSDLLPAQGLMVHKGT